MSKLRKKTNDEETESEAEVEETEKKRSKAILYVELIQQQVKAHVKASEHKEEAPDEARLIRAKEEEKRAHETTFKKANETIRSVATSIRQTRERPVLRRNLEIKRQQLEDEANAARDAHTYQEKMNRRLCWMNVYIVNLANEFIGKRELPAKIADSFSAAAKRMIEDPNSHFEPYNTLYRKIRDDRYWRALSRSDLKEYVHWASEVFQVARDLEELNAINSRVMLLCLLVSVYDDFACEESAFVNHASLDVIIKHLYQHLFAGDTLSQEEAAELRNIQTTAPPLAASAMHLHREISFYPFMTYDKNEHEDDVFGALDAVREKVGRNWRKEPSVVLRGLLGPVKLSERGKAKLFVPKSGQASE